MYLNILLTIICILLSNFVNAQADFIWGTQFGTQKEDKTRNLIIDKSDNIYVVGKTQGVLGEEHFGKNDGFITKIDSAANIMWHRQIGSTYNDELSHVAVDEVGNIYATGFIEVINKTKAINQDILIVKYDPDGEIVWQKQFGTDSTDVGTNIAIGSNSEVFIVGYTKGFIGNKLYGEDDCIILHLDTHGKQLNVVQFGTPGSDICGGICISPDEKIYVSGSTSGSIAANNMGKMDMFWGSFSSNLEQLEMMQSGTKENDYAQEIKVDKALNVYLAGSTNGSTQIQQKGNGDAFLQKWNNKNELLYTKQFGTNNWDGIHSIAVIEDKGIVVSGCYDYPLCKSFIKMYNNKGSVLWNKSFIGQGIGGGTCGKDLCVNPQGIIFHAGYTGANLFSELKGEHDLFLVKLKANF